MTGLKQGFEWGISSESKFKNLKARKQFSQKESGKNEHILVWKNPDTEQTRAN